MNQDAAMRTASLRIQPSPQQGDRMYLVTFVDRTSGQELSTRLLIHAVELRRLSISIGKMLDGESDIAGIEGVYLL
jgi:hypothetical protein